MLITVVSKENGVPNKLDIRNLYKVILYVVIYVPFSFPFPVSEA